MSIGQFMQALSALPQIIESIKKMNAEDKKNFVEKLGLEGEEKETAINIISCFQEGKPLSPQEQISAQKLMEKALQMSNLNMSDLLNLSVNKPKQQE